MWDASGNLSGIALPELIRLIVEGEYQVRPISEENPMKVNGGTQNRVPLGLPIMLMDTIAMASWFDATQMPATLSFLSGVQVAARD
jgi:hypothetical protein